METKDIALLAVTLLILGEVTYLLARLPKTSIKSKERPILIDTSVLMDGRITSIASTGFMGGALVIPRSVVGELQFLADNADADKRARARRGLDVITELQAMPMVTVEVLQDGSKAQEGVDERLLSLAKQYTAAICTIDYNLNKVAAVEGIPVLNINELAQSLRMAYLPGEHMMVELAQKGQDSHQGVGYLADGTMVVVEQASNLIGQTVSVEVIRSLQTAAGKMMFARRASDKSIAKPTQSRLQRSRTQDSSHKMISQKESVSPKKTGKNDRDQRPFVPRQKSSRSLSSPRRQDRESALIDLVEKQP
jgi:uncharacterized protein YacL